MTRSLAKIREQLTQLDSQTESQWHRLAKTYDQYVDCLSRLLQRQGVYAVYQICTQIYPEAFLKLSYGDRHTFQQQIRAAIEAFQPGVTAMLQKQGITLDPSQLTAEPDSQTDTPPPAPAPPDNLPQEVMDEAPAAVTVPTPEPTATDAPPPDSESTASNRDENFPTMQEIKNFLHDALEKEGLSLDMLIPQMLRLDQAQTPITVKTPEDLVQWHRQVEKLLQRALVRLSMSLNSSLTERKIIPENLPLRVLEMALQAEDDRLAPNRDKMPHIVNLFVEMAHQSIEKDDTDDTDEDDNPDEDGDRPNPLDQDEDDEDEDDDEDDAEGSETARGEISRLTIINLRLADLEFSDVSLSMIRKQIRTYLFDLKKLRQQHRQLNRDRLAVEAELAWRSSWTGTETPKPSPQSTEG